MEDGSVSNEKNSVAVDALKTINGFSRFCAFRVFYSKLIWIAIVVFGATLSHAEDRSKIDPSTEKVLVTVGGVNFDIPLGYFYEKTVWAKGAWPVPNKERTTEKGPLVLVAHLDGMKPWSRELSADFGGGRALTTRITIQGDLNPMWLENFMAYRVASLSESRIAPKLPGLIAYVSAYTKSEINYLAGMPPSKPYFQILCDTRPSTVMCEVFFDYQKTIVVKYLVPVSQLNNWKSTHAEIVALLNKLQTN